MPSLSLNQFAQSEVSNGPQTNDQVIRETASTEPSTALEHLMQSHHLVRRIGAGMFGEIYLAIEKTAADNLYGELRRMGGQQIYEQLKSKVVVAKVPKALSKGVSTTYSIRAEIRILTEILPSQHPRIIEVLSNHVDDSFQWFTAPFAPWGDLEAFCMNFKGEIPISFVWHIGLQYAEAIVFLLFDVKNANAMTPTKGWPQLCHGDGHAANILLSPSSDGFGNFPDMILADFGLAEHFEEGNRDQGASLQLEELESLAHVLGLLFRSTAPQEDDSDGDGLTQWIHQLIRLSNVRQEGSDIGFVLPVLSDFMATARRDRQERYRALPPVVAETMANRMVSNEQLDKVLNPNQTVTHPSEDESDQPESDQQAVASGGILWRSIELGTKE